MYLYKLWTAPNVKEALQKYTSLLQKMSLLDGSFAKQTYADRLVCTYLYVLKYVQTKRSA